MQRKIIFGIAIVVIVVVGTFVVRESYTGTPAPTAVVTNSGWKVYQDNANGLSFEYPPTLVADTQDNDGYSIVSVTDPKNHALYVSIVVVSDPSQPGIDDMFIGPYPKEIPPTSNASVMTVNQKTFNGLQGIEVYGYISEGHSYNDEFMYKNNRLWKVHLDPVLEGRITEYPELGTPTPDKDTYERILASIQISS